MIETEHVSQQPGSSTSVATAANRHSLDDRELLVALAARDQEALTALYDRHAPVVFGFLCERLGAGERAETALVETFERLWRHPPVVERDRPVLVQWLLIHARLLAASTRAQVSSPASATEGPSQTAERLRLEDILITPQLSCRLERAPNYRAENDAFFHITRKLANRASAAVVLQTLVDTATELCGAGTAGLSLLEAPADGNEQVFRWTHMAGALAGAVGGTTPRNFSPCGVTLDRGAPQLFAYPARYFEYLGATPAPIVEGLVIPFSTGAGEDPEGTIWIVSHDVNARRFDWEDARVMTSLASFTAIALQAAASPSGEGSSFRAA